MDNRRITQKPWGRLWNFVPLKGEGEAGSGGDCSDVVEIWSREAGGCALYATDTRIGCRLSLPPGKALRCSPWGGRRGASLSPAADRGKGAALFSAHRDYASTAEKPPTGRFFWVVRYSEFAGNFFSYKKFPNPQGNFALWIFPSKGA